jgi:hypothetical protein
VSGIGEAISREGHHIVVNTNSERVAGLSLLAAFQCVLQTLEVADAHLSLDITVVVHNLGKNFRETLDSLYRTRQENK